MSTFTIADARRYLLNLLPPGAELLYGYASSTAGDVWKFFDAAGEFFKTYGFDLLDVLRLEIFPQTADQKLPDWEAAAGISKLNPARFGTKAQRQAAVVAKLREFGPFCDPVTESVLAPLLGYNATTVPEIIKTDRAAMNDAHTYLDTVELATPPAGDPAMVRDLWIFDGALVGKMGARWCVKISHTAVETVAISLTSPDGTQSATVALPGTGAAVGVEFWFFCPEFVGKTCAGRWRFTIVDTDVAETGTIHDWRVFVEGAPGGLGGDAANWGVYADPLHLGENGVPEDLAAAKFAIARIQHADADGGLVLAKGPIPDTSGAIPDECIPD